MFNEQAVLNKAQRYNSFYLYDEKSILKYTQRLKDHFPDINFLYSIKANPHKHVIKSVFSQGFGADAASLGEVLLGSKLGLSKEEIYYSAPGKTDNDILNSIDKSIIIADSLTEIERINAIANDKNIVVEIGVRINPNFTFYSDRGLPSKFGIDEDDFYKHYDWINSLSGVNIVGIHVHSRSQELDVEVMKKYYKNMFNLSCSVQDKLGIQLKFINLGSGLGIPYSSKDEEIDTNELGRQTVELLDQFKEKLAGVKIYIETGRYAVCKCGVYATKVLDIKTSYGEKFVILDNTLNGFIRPSLAHLIMSYSKDENPSGNEPLFTQKNAFDFIVLANSAETKHKDKVDRENVTLVGNLCTSADIIADDIDLPTINIGDVLVVTNAGSYAAVLSPRQFASMIVPQEFFLTKSGEII